MLGYVDQGGVGIVQASLDTGAFDKFFFGDGMYGQSLIDKIGDEINGKVIGTLPGTEGVSTERFTELSKAAGFDPTATYVPEAYDAAALISLAIAAGGSADRTVIRDNVLKVANAPGEKIYAGELAKGIELAAAGTDIDYVGATSVELIGPGEARGSYRVYDHQGQHHRDSRLSLIPSGRPARDRAPAGPRPGDGRMIRVRGPSHAFRRPPGRRRRVDRDRHGLDHRADRAERRRKVDALQRHSRAVRADLGPGLARRGGDHRAQSRTRCSTRGCCAPSRSPTSSRR